MSDSDPTARFLTEVANTALSRKIGFPIMAHRGIHSGSIAENSAASLEACVDAGTALEVDLFFFDSGETCLLHGPPSKSAANALMRGSPPAGLCSLAEAFSILDGKVPLNAELKYLDLANPDVLSKAMGQIREYAGPVAVTSFDVELMDLRPQLPGIPFGFISLARIPPAARDADFFALNRSLLKLAGLLQSIGRPLGTWTYPNIKSMIGTIGRTQSFGIVDIRPQDIASL